MVENSGKADEKRLRLETVDIIRGITIISMILYHFCWDLKYLKGFDMPWYGTFGSYLWQQSICWCFIFIAGFCLHFARSPIRNGAITFLCGVIITCVTELFVPEAPVYFGVLTFLGSAMLIVGAARLLLMRVLPGDEGRDFAVNIDPFWGFIISVLLFGVTKAINRGFLNLFITKIMLPDTLYGADGTYNSFLTYLGFMQDGFYSSDYFSIMPWIFLFLAGYYAYGVLKKRFGKEVFHFEFRPLSWIGKHSLLIYMLHQPVLYGISMLIR